MILDFGLFVGKININLAMTIIISNNRSIKIIIGN